MSEKESCWRAVLMSEDESVRGALLDVLRRRISIPDEAVYAEWQSAQVVLNAIGQSGANVCFIDVGGLEERALSTIRNLAGSNLTVVAVHIGNDSGLILRCIRCGAHEFLNGPFEADVVWQALDDLAARRLRGAAQVTGSVYMVLPAKPNLGSTTVATSLALRARAEAGSSVLLADLDPLYGSIAFHLKIKSRYTFVDVFSNWEKIDSDLWSNLVVCQAGMDVLIAPEASGTCDFTAPNAAEFLAFLRRRYSHAFLDCPGLVTPWYSQLAAAADEVILVTTNELTALHATKRSLVVLEASGIKAATVKIVVNRYEPERGLPSNSIETALRTSVFHTLSNDYDAVQEAIFDGKPVSSNSRLGKGLDGLWARLMRRDAVRPPTQFWTSLLSGRKRQLAAEKAG